MGWVGGAAAGGGECGWAASGRLYLLFRVAVSPRSTSYKPRQA